MTGWDRICSTVAKNGRHDNNNKMCTDIGGLPYKDKRGAARDRKEKNLDFLDRQGGGGQSCFPRNPSRQKRQIALARFDQDLKGHSSSLLTTSQGLGGSGTKGPAVSNYRLTVEVRDGLK